MSAKPSDLLLPYQKDWASDTSRFKIGCWARQTGKSWTTGFEAVTDCMARKTMYVCLSTGERQALEWMQKARDWAEAYQFAIGEYAELRDGDEALLKAAEIRWPNGSRLVAIPANPATARGYSANLILDEFAFHDDPDGIWRSVYPSISNPLKGEYKIRIVSTPNGKGNTFAKIWGEASDWSPSRAAVGKGKWSRHKIDIHSAVARGLPVDVEELRQGLNDPEGWAQEYECDFLDTAAVLLPYDVIAQIENPLATTQVPPEYWTTRGAPVELGIDFGRRRNLTVSWAMEDSPGGYKLTREVLELDNMPTNQQVEVLSVRIQRARKASIDYTGPGIGLGDYLVEKFGEWAPDKHKFGKIELCTFSTALKVDIFSKLRMIADRRMVGIPATRVIREDLHSVHRVTTPAGQITYSAPLTANSHADRCTALALAIRAGATVSSPFAYRAVDRPPRGRWRHR